ncbi:DUF3618 domain-containing protein [Streptosporangium saharense]|uniref:DUF3618 domain-containing protein n=1 Tax=Streptosporangium saharense TaxID=1706840 RepID=A0A7W7QN96_9ACTN|nr:DUF3618 domain-containing protein [Streptosporangium saharense]MBB4916717.1 hypothetical protein [Streptosporangium saharense]
MSESDPGRSGGEIHDAGTVGAHRQRVGAPVTPDEEMSLNVPPKQPDGTPSSVPESRRDNGTPRLPEKDTGHLRAVGKTHETDVKETGKTNRESVRRDIERDRRELGETVEALVHKTDVKGRVQETAAQVGDELRKVGAATAATATEVVERVKNTSPAEVKEKVTTGAAKRPAALVAAVAVLGLVVFRVLRRGKRK